MPRKKNVKTHIRLVMKKIEQPATRSALQHPLIDAVRSDEPEHIHRLRLSNPVGPIHSLQIRLWIPVVVVENDNISSGQIDTESSSASGEQERKMNFLLL